MQACSEGKSFVRSDSLDKAQVEIPAPYPAFLFLGELYGYS